MKVHTICHMLVNGISVPPGTFEELPSNLGIKHTEKEKKEHRTKEGEGKPCRSQGLVRGWRTNREARTDPNFGNT